MNKKQIKDLALSNGFKLKEQPSGEMDLNPYVYEFASALIAKANERVAIYKRGINKAIEAIEREDDSSAYDAISHLENALQLRKEQDNE